MHDPEKHALGLDPMGAKRFSEKDHAQSRISARHNPPLVLLTCPGHMRPGHFRFGQRCG
jgi:hypothetical protein